MARTSTARSHAPPRAHPHRRPNESKRETQAQAQSKPQVGTSTLLKVSGWRRSKAASNPDGGVDALTKFLERRGAMHKKAPLRIRKSRVDGDNFIVTISAEDAKPLLGINGFSFAGAKLSVEHMPSSATRSSNSTFSFPGRGADDVTTIGAAAVSEKFKAILAKRYKPDTLLLDLSALGEDPDLNSMGIRDIVSRSNFFPALMKVCNQTFDTAEKKQAAIASISLARNNLLKATPIRALADTFPDLKNLDLSGNKFKSISSLMPWTNQFSKLEHLLLTDMPLSATDPKIRLQIIRLFPSLQIIDNIGILPEEREAATSDKPLPTSRAAVFDDPDGIAQNFLRAYFAAFDSDRAILATEAYDEDSTFSVAVNNSTLKGTIQPTREWGAWLPLSRNLHRLNNAGARAKRLHRGRDDINKALSSLPVTKHPDFELEAQKWLIECRLQTGLPDPSGLASAGVNGYLITIHGEFDEIDASSAMQKRSFDRTMIIGPGGSKGVRIINDMLTVRSYAGFDAFVPETQKSSSPTAEAETKVKAVTEVRQQTGMNEQYAVMCLESTNWNVADALVMFGNVRATIPPEAFAQ